MFTNRKRTLPMTPALVASVALAAAAAMLVPSAAEAGDACKTKDFKYDKVKAACADGGGRKAAKKVMKDAVKKAKKSGDKMKCKTCHEDVKTYELKSNIDKEVERLKKYF